MTASALTKIDLKREFRELYAPGTTPRLVEVPELNYLMIDGRGDPNTSAEYLSAIPAMYTLAYTLKFQLKRQLGSDFVVMPLEGLWWVADMSQFAESDKSDWDGTLLMALPDDCDAERVEQARVEAARKKDLKALARIRLKCMAEGRCAEVLHMGPYAEEGPTVAKLHAFLAGEGYVPTGKHHEIYLSDPGRTAPERLRTIVRQPVSPAASG